MNILSLALLFISVAVFVVAVRLHFVIVRHVAAGNPRCLAHKTDLFRAAHGAMFLSAAYSIAEVRWLIMELDVKIPSIDDILWNCLEACFLVYIAWVCIVGCKLVRSNWDGCKLED